MYHYSKLWTQNEAHKLQLQIRWLGQLDGWLRCRSKAVHRVYRKKIHFMFGRNINWFSMLAIIRAGARLKLITNNTSVVRTFIGYYAEGVRRLSSMPIKVTHTQNMKCIKHFGNNPKYCLQHIKTVLIKFIALRFPHLSDAR